MSFADTYFKRFPSKGQIIKEQPDKELFLSIVIPAFDEPDLNSSLQSLLSCKLPEKSVEVIVVINSSESDSEAIISKNRKTYEDAKKYENLKSNSKIKFHILKFENLPKKFAGVGLARKIGMDEALHRFNLLNRAEGLIAGFDADSLVEMNYLTEIEKYFQKNTTIEAASIHFEHPISGTVFNVDIYKKIINYELHLRYFNEALKYANFPFAYHTVGSSFVVRAAVYAAEGGMNRKKAGEDFYFLQKIIQRGRFGEINSTGVIPSPRISDRVPFGTGAAIRKMVETANNDFLTYKFEIFTILKEFFETLKSFYTHYSKKNINELIQEFLNDNKFEDNLNKIISNCSNEKSFQKKIFEWFNAFRVIRFLNFVHVKHYKKCPALSESQKLLKVIRPNIKIPTNEKDLLILYRKIQKKEL